MDTSDPARKIKARRRGNALGFFFFRVSVRLFGLRGAYGLLYIVCSYYLLFDRPAVRAAMAYARRRFTGHGRLRLFADVYLLFVNQGKHLIDRHYLLAGGPKIRSEIVGLEKLSATLASPQGFILLTAHLGNWQVVMSAMRGLGRKTHLVMRPEDNRALEQALRISTGESGYSIISPEGALGGVVPIMNALKAGGLVSIMGDRSYQFSAVDVEFLGAPARFSCGALHIAALAECPVVVLTSAKTSLYDYVVRVDAVTHPRYVRGAPKREQLRGWVQEFARLMERYVEQYPYQCFLFHDLWSEAGAPVEAGTASTRT